MRAIPINAAEAIFEAFWDPEISGFREYSFRPNVNTRARISQFWCWVELTWETAKPGEHVATLTRELQLDLEDYDGLLVQCTMPDTAALTVRVIVDGREKVSIERARGVNGGEEYAGKLEGKKLEKIELVFESIRGGPGAAYLQWIGIFNYDIKARMEARKPPFSPDWPGLIKPLDERITPKPTLGIFFGPEDLEAIRRRAQSPPYRPIMDEMRSVAQSLLNRQPEEDIWEFAPTHRIWGDRCRYGRVRNSSKPSMTDPARICAFVGLIDEDPDLLRMAARFALSLAHCRYWCEGFTGRFPGSRWHHRCFYEYANTVACVFTLDWAGSVLTERGVRLVLHAMGMKGLPTIDWDFAESEYIHHMNQGIFFSYGRILGLLALQRHYPRVAGRIDLAEKVLFEIFDNYVMEDGGSHEGMAIWNASVSEGITALIALARYRGIPIKEYLPKKLLKSVDFAFTMLSTAGLPGEYLTIGDAVPNVLSHDTVAMMSAAHDDPRWKELLAGMLKRVPEATHTMTMIYGPESLPPPRVSIPTFSRLPYTGQLTSCRETSMGPIRLHLVGAKAEAGHLHEDKGGFILEAFGEALAIDRGMTPYADPRCPLLDDAIYHNMLTPVMPDRTHPHQLNPCPTAIIPQGEGDEQRLSASIDTTPAWNGLFRKHTRQIESPRPELFFISDDVMFDEPRQASFHLHSYHPIRKDNESFLVEGDKAVLSATPLWTTSGSRFEEDLVDREFKPVWHLMLTSEPIITRQLVTALQVFIKSKFEMEHLKADQLKAEAAKLFSSQL